MKKLVFGMVILFSAIHWAYGQEEEGMDIRIDKEVNYLHFIDHLSQWSPYTGQDALHLYTAHFSFSKQDSSMIDLYKLNRVQLGWEYEISLFNWAYEDYSFTNVSDSCLPELENMKVVLEYFRGKKNDEISLLELLDERFEKLKKIEKDIFLYSLKMDSILKTMESKLEIWNPDIDYQSYPVYICYAHQSHSAHGGANGEGVYSEFLLSDKSEDIENGFGMITHELVHKVTRIAEYLLQFIEREWDHSIMAQQFYEKHDIDPPQLLAKFKSVNPNGFGNPEAKVFEEINVYYFSPVCLHQLSSQDINKKQEYYSKKGVEELARIWKGIPLFKREYENYNAQKSNHNAFVWGLVDAYYSGIYED